MSITKEESGSCASFTGDLTQMGLSPKQACDLRGKERMIKPVLGAARGRGRRESLCWRHSASSLGLGPEEADVPGALPLWRAGGKAAGRGWAAISCQVGTCWLCPNTSQALEACTALWVWLHVAVLESTCAAQKARALSRGAGSGSGPGPTLSSFPSTGRKVTLTATLGLYLNLDSCPDSGQCVVPVSFGWFKFHCYLLGTLAISFLPQICPL